MFDFMFDKDNSPGFLTIAFFAILIVFAVVNYIALFIEYGFWYVTSAYMLDFIISALIIFYVNKND